MQLLLRNCTAGIYNLRDGAACKIYDPSPTGIYWYVSTIQSYWSPHMIHHNPDIYPDSLIIRPGRFLANLKLEIYLMSFRQGPRQCLGMRFAYGELYLVIMGVWTRFGSEGIRWESGEIELFEADREDVEMRYDILCRLGRGILRSFGLL
jgi:hypothetical protein